MIFTHIDHEKNVISFKCDKDEFEYFLSCRDDFNLFKNCNECIENNKLKSQLIKLMLQIDRLKNCNNCFHKPASDNVENENCKTCKEQNNWKIQDIILNDVEFELEEN